MFVCGGYLQPARRRRNANVPHRKTYRLARHAHPNVNTIIEEYTTGLFTCLCRFCGAKYFVDEYNNSRGDYNMCCRLGKVSLPELAPKSRCIKKLTYVRGPKHLRTHIRTVNDHFAMASFQYTKPDSWPPQGGVWCFKIMGQVYHQTCPVPPNRTEELWFNQLYFVDAGEAMTIRQNSIADRVTNQILYDLDNMFGTVNPLTQSFESIGSVVENLDPDTRLNNVTVNNVNNIRRDLRNYDPPQCRSEIAAIFLGEVPPVDVWI